MKKKKSILKTVLGSIIVLFLLMVGVALGSDTEPPVITPNNQIVEYDTILRFAELASAENYVLARDVIKYKKPSENFRRLLFPLYKMPILRRCLSHDFFE